MNEALDKAGWDNSYNLQGKALAEFCEKLLTAQSTKESVFQISSLKHNPHSQLKDPDVFKITVKFLTRPRGDFEVYSIMGLKFVIIGGKGYIFDRAHLLHLRECSQKVCAAREFALSFRVLGSPRLSAYLQDF